MKKIIVLFALIILMGTGCLTTAPETTEPQTEFVQINWEHSAYLGSLCLNGGETHEIDPLLAKQIGFPNGPTDHLCIGEGSELIDPDPEFEESGTALVHLGEMKLVSDVQGMVYHIEILEVK